jgi:hypothetical protein
MKKDYVKPVVETESVFEALAGGCTLMTEADASCNHYFDGTSLEGGYIGS